MRKVLAREGPGLPDPDLVEKKVCPTRRAEYRALRAKRRHYTPKRVEISKPVGIWKAREGRQEKHQDKVMKSKAAEQKSPRREGKKT